jgi:sigma-E factor negative regulatory protein RseC
LVPVRAFPLAVIDFLLSLPPDSRKQNMPSATIIHPGIVERVDDKKVLVRILSQSACSSCHAKGACTVADLKDKIIEVDRAGEGEYAPGDEVMVTLSESLGKKAVVLGYVLPLIILVASIIIFLSLLNNEGLAALLSILMLGPYYLVLYFFRNRLRKEFRFRIE